MVVGAGLGKYCLGVEGFGHCGLMDWRRRKLVFDSSQIDGRDSERMTGAWKIYT